MSDQKKQLFQIYFAGASLAFGLPFLVVEVISLIVGDALVSQYPEFFGFLYTSLHSLGGILGGALVAGRVMKDDIFRAGVISGLMAYLLHQVIYYLFYGVSVIGDTYTLFSLVGGSIIGALYIRQKRSKQKEKKEEELPS